MQKTTRTITYVAAFIAFSTNGSLSHAISVPEIAQIVTAALIAPTTWASDAAQANQAIPAVTNSLLILADINRLVHDALMYYNEESYMSPPALHDSAGWVSCTASLNLYLLAEHILALKNGTAQAELLSLGSPKAPINKGLAAGRITLPALESLCSLIIALGKDNKTRINAKFGKSLAQHGNQLLHCNRKEQLKIIACVAALLADCYIANSSKNTLNLMIEEQKRQALAAEAEANRRRCTEEEAARREAQATDPLGTILGMVQGQGSRPASNPLNFLQGSAFEPLIQEVARGSERNRVQEIFGDNTQIPAPLTQNIVGQIAPVNQPVILTAPSDEECRAQTEHVNEQLRIRRERLALAAEQRKNRQAAATTIQNTQNSSNAQAGVNTARPQQPQEQIHSLRNEVVRMDAILREFNPDGSVVDPINGPDRLEALRRPAPSTIPFNTTHLELRVEEAIGIANAALNTAVLELFQHSNPFDQATHHPIGAHQQVEELDSNQE